MPDETKRRTAPEFSVSLVDNDICSCGACFARNTKTGNAPAEDIYNVRIGGVTIRMCARCLSGMHASLGAALEDIKAREVKPE